MMSKKIFVFGTILTIVAITVSHRLVGQETDPAPEQGKATETTNETKAEMHADADSESAKKGTGGPAASDDEAGEDVQQIGNPEDELFKPASMWPQGDYLIFTPYTGRDFHFGPTGLWGIPVGQNIYVTRVDAGSPADGKIMRGDFIYGVKGKTFPADRDFRIDFSQAITEAETKEAGGVMPLDVRQKGQLKQIPIQLEVMGSFSETTPYNCEKSDKIVARAEKYMSQGLRPETGWPNNGAYMYGPFHDSVLFLLATGSPETQGLVRRYIRNEIDRMESKRKEGQPIGGIGGGWDDSFLKMLFGEYYHLTGDPSVLPYLGPRVTPAGLERDWSWPPKEPTAYGTHPHQQMAETIGDVLAKEAGVQIDQQKLEFDLKYLYVKRAEYGYVKYIGYGKRPIEARQIDAVEEIPETAKENGTFSAMNGKPAMAAALYSLVSGYEPAIEQCSMRSVYAFNRTNRGHGGIWFNQFWTPIGASKAGPEKFTYFFKGQQWWRELFRDHSGGMWQTGNAKGKASAMGTGFAIHYAIPRKKLRIFGAPRSMFGPEAPAYMQEALAAHRNRDYALAEQLSRKLVADGKVPAEEQERVDHFINSVKTLKESIEYDLTFTESKLKKGDFLIASIELAQLKMVVSPNNPRFKAIENLVEANRGKIPSLDTLVEQMIRENNKVKLDGKDNRKDNVEEEIASGALIKDGATYEGYRGRRTVIKLPKFGKNELHPWSMKVFQIGEEVPQGWEQPNFDDSAWSKIAMEAKWKPKAWKPNTVALLRTSFDINNPDALGTLRFRLKAGSQSNMSVHLNGELIAKSANMPLEFDFDLPASWMHLLRAGKNTLAIKTQRGNSESTFSLRLVGIPGQRPANENGPSAKNANPKKTPAQAAANVPSTDVQAPMNHHEEIEFMLGHLKKVQPKILIGNKEYPAIQVHDYLASFYGKHKDKVVSREMFLEKIAAKTQGGLIYYVVDDKGGNTMLKDWLESSLPRRK